MSEATAAPAGHSVKASTEYVVLEYRESELVSGWQNAANITARSADHAVRAYAETAGGTVAALTLVAVPARHWKPVTLKPQTVTTWETA